VPVGLGVDGSASNDGAHLLVEARQAMPLARVGGLATVEIEPFLDRHRALVRSRAVGR